MTILSLNNRPVKSSEDFQSEHELSGSALIDELCESEREEGKLERQRSEIETGRGEGRKKERRGRRVEERDREEEGEREKRAERR